jgi:hypothetical protein
MSSDVNEVRDVLAVLAPKIENCIDQLDAQIDSNAICALQNMSSAGRACSAYSSLSSTASRKRILWTAGHG